MPGDGESLPLLHDLARVPAEHVRHVSHVKRALERWVMDASFRDAFDLDPPSALASLHVALTPDELRPMVDPALARSMTQAAREGRAEAFPLSTRRYRAFIQEKLADRRAHREACAPDHPLIGPWRKRQVARCASELGLGKADALVHAPLAIELSQGCSGGCWFCGVDARRLEAVFPHTPANRELFVDCLQALRDVLGPAARYGFLYWATDPLDNPDYERFVADYHAVLGRCPQTTTALAPRDLPRVRSLLEQARALDSVIDRLSIVRLADLDAIHGHFSPEELLRVELVPQNPEATSKHAKAAAGRVRRRAARHAEEDRGVEEASTIACVSGFLLNMIARTVRLVTPCAASERWPQGFRLVDEGTFADGDDLRRLLETMATRSLRASLGVDDVVRPLGCLRCEVRDGELLFVSRYLKHTFRNWPASSALRSLLEEGTHTAGDIALRLEREAQVPLDRTFLLLIDLFARGLLEEDPASLQKRPLAAAHA